MAKAGLEGWCTKFPLGNPRHLQARAQALGGRTNLGMAQPLPPSRQGLRGDHSKLADLAADRQCPPPHPPSRKGLKYGYHFESDSQDDGGDQSADNGYGTGESGGARISASTSGRSL